MSIEIIDHSAYFPDADLVSFCVARQENEVLTATGYPDHVNFSMAPTCDDRIRLDVSLSLDDARRLAAFLSDHVTKASALGSGDDAP